VGNTTSAPYTMKKGLKFVDLLGVVRKLQSTEGTSTVHFPARVLSYLVFMPKPSTHRMHDPGSIVPHIRPKVFSDKQMSRIKYNYYISNVSKDYVNSQ
jgi:hypothetical protein